MIVMSTLVKVLQLLLKFLLMLICASVFANASKQEALRTQLLELMTQQNPLGISWPGFENLYNSIIADPQLEKLVTLEFDVRRVAWLEFAEPCDPSRQTILDNPPISPSPPEIISWFRNLLSPPLTLYCNYLHYLHCSPETWTCTCREGLVQSPQGLCVLQAGTNCGSDFYFRNFYFDPLSGSKSLVIQPPPECHPGLTCCHRPLFFRKKCWCRDSHQDPPCDNFPIFSQKSEYLRLRLQMRNLFTLDHGSSCDPELQHQILDPPEYDLIDTRGRVIYLEQILRSRSTLKLCDISKHLNCSEETRQCECWRSRETGKSLIYDSKISDCLANRGFPCGNTSLEATFYPPASPTVWELQNVFTIEQGLEVKCGHEGTCQSNTINAVQTCACSGHFFGEDCASPGSNLTLALRRPKIFNPSISPAEVDCVFDHVNEKMVLLEKRLCLGFQSSCDLMQESTMDSIHSFWNNLTTYWGLGQDSLEVEPWSTIQSIMDVTDVATELLENEGLQLCNRSQGLCCNDRTSKCVCPRGTTRQNSSCRIMAGHDCVLSIVPFHLLCVRYATCIRKLGIPGRLNQGICKCSGDAVQTIENGESICIQPSDLDPVTENVPLLDLDNGPKHQNGDKLPSLGRSLDKPDAMVVTIQPPILSSTSERLTGTRSLTSGPVTSRAATHHHHANEVHVHLLEMRTHRALSLNDPCFIADNVRFRMIAQQYSDANKFHVNTDGGLVEANLHELTTLLATGSNFCDIQKHLHCSAMSATCQCPPGLLPNDNQECRIPAGEPCSPNPVHLKHRDLGRDFIIPFPACHSGLVCELNVTLGGDTICTLGKGGHFESRKELKSAAVPFVFLNFKSFLIAIFFVLVPSHFGR